MISEQQRASISDTYVKEFTTRNTFAKALVALLNNMIRERGIEPLDIQSRTKTLDSIFDKIERKKIRIGKKPLSKIYDFTGIRIITAHPDEANSISTIIDTEFNVSQELSEDKSKTIKHNEFGYLSIHKIVSLPEVLRHDKEWGYSKDFFFEIQIRTILQHAWASASHKMIYKRDDDIPPKIKRRLSLLAGLLELADHEFQTIRDLIPPRGHEQTNSKTTISLNIDTVKKFLTISEFINKYTEYANSVGFTIIDTIRDAFVDQLLSVIIKAKITTFESLNKFTDAKFESMKLALKAFKSAWGNNSYNKDALMIMIFILISRDTIDMTEITKEWSTEFADYLKKAASVMDEDKTHS